MAGAPSSMSIGQSMSPRPMLEHGHGHGHHQSHSYGEDQLQQLQQLQQQQLVVVGKSTSAGSLELPGPTGPSGPPSLGAGGGSSRPTSARYKPPVLMLVDAVRSKEEQQVQATLAYLEPPGSTSGAEGGTRTRVPGINERHPVTGRTALNEAVILGQVGIVRTLLQAGADPNVPHRTQGPPIMHCAASGETELMELLLAYQAHVNVFDISGEAQTRAAVPCAAGWHWRAPLCHCVWCGCRDA